jgi:phospholipid transport system transporter-binding protein
MADASIEDDGNGRLALAGDLCFATVPKLWLRWRELAGGRKTLDVDLCAVRRSDSAGLALLIEGMRYARRTGQSIRFFNIPAQMLEMARVSGLEAILPLQPQDC